MQHQRDSHLIRTDAIKIGLKKAQQGCITCAATYFELAKQHGATQTELQQAVNRITSQQDKNKFGRRNVLKLLATLGTAGIIAGVEQLEEKVQQALAAPFSVPTWWGTDSNTQSSYGIPQHFYIGRMGSGTQPIGDNQFFNVNAARQAGYYRTYGYWILQGPGSKPDHLSAASWGQQQASCAWNAWHAGPHSAQIGGHTIFADIESGGGGWDNGNQNDNQDVLEGFLQHCFELTRSTARPGVYISPHYWNSFFGSSFQPSCTFVLWLTGLQTCGSGICPPCNAKCDTLSGVKAHLATEVAKVVVGGQKPVVWQYWIGSCGCGDYNVMMQNATALLPKSY